MADKVAFTIDELGEAVPHGDRTFDDIEGYAVVPEGRDSVTVTCKHVHPQTKVFAELNDVTDAIYKRGVTCGRGFFTIQLSGVTSGARLCSFHIVR